MFLFDTDHLGILQIQTDPEYSRLHQRIRDARPTEFFTSIISFHEQIRGWNAYLARSRNSSGVVKAYGRLERILRDFSRAQVMPFDDVAADVFDDLRKQRVRIGTMDLRIAAIALANDLTLLTRNAVDFSRVPGLSFEDWTV